MSADYAAFLDTKAQSDLFSGFDPRWLPEFLFDFQSEIVDWAIRKGKGAIFADCGLGKTPMQLVWADNVVRHTNKPVLIATPLAVSHQTLGEADKFGIDCERIQDGAAPKCPRVAVTNYERLHLFDPKDFSGLVCDESSILKNFDGVRRATVTEFMRTLPYRLLCTATAAPNDYIELGTSSEALGRAGPYGYAQPVLPQYPEQRESPRDAWSIPPQRTDEGVGGSKGMPKRLSGSGYVHGLVRCGDHPILDSMTRSSRCRRSKK